MPKHHIPGSRKSHRSRAALATLCHIDALEERRLLSGATQNQLIFAQQPAEVPAGSPTPSNIVVDVKDGSGHVVTRYDSNVSLAIQTGPLGALIQGTVTVAAVNGVATFSSLTFPLGGSYTLSATDASNDSPATSSEFTVDPSTAGSWTAQTGNIPAVGAGLSLLLTNGDVMVHGGEGVSNAWNELAPDASGGYVDGSWTPLKSMSVQRLYFGSCVLPNGEVFVVGGEYSGPAGDNNFTPTAEIYNPATNTWKTLPSDPVGQFGDDPTELLPDGNILCGDIEDNGTEIFDPSNDTWTTGPTKVYDDQSDEESWVKLPDGSILTYDIFSSIAGGTPEAERYIPSENEWVDASNGDLPMLSSAANGYELGPAVLLPDGRVFISGTNGDTAYFDSTTDTWTQGPTIPDSLTSCDNPAAVLPNGDVLIAVAPPVTIEESGEEDFPGPASIFELNTNTGVYTDVTPPSSIISLSEGSDPCTFLVLPTGQVMLTNQSGKIAIYSSGGVPQSAWAPTITNVANSGGVYTLTGTQINGLDEGAAFGDDAQMATNYPIIFATDSITGQQAYATTFNWSSVGVATGSTPGNVQFTPPTSFGSDPFSLQVIANGITSSTLDPFPHLVFSQQPTTTFVGDTIAPSVTVEIEDKFGNVLTSDNSEIVLSVASGPSTDLNGTLSVAAQDGVATFSDLSLDTGGSYTLLATDATDNTPPLTSDSFTLNQTPSITSDSSATFMDAQAGSFLVTANGFPVPALEQSAALPAGVTFVDNGNGTATLSGTPTDAGTFDLAFTAANGQVPSATQTFTLTVDQIPAISSANAATFEVGTAGSFLLTATGFPLPSLSEAGTLPAGVIFIDNGNGTASLSGTPTASARGIFGFTITATNGVSPNATQTFTVTVSAPAQVGGGNTASKLAFTTEPQDVAKNASFMVAISVEDQGGNVVTTDDSNVTLLIASGTLGAELGGVLQVAAVNGVAQFQITLSKPGAFTLLATDGADASATSTNFSIGKLAFSQQPTNTTAGSVIPLTVNVEKPNGLAISADNSSIALSIVSGPAGSVISGNATVVASNGVATFNGLTFTTAGSYVLEATAGGLSTESAPFAISAAAPAHFAFVQQPTDVTAGQKFSPKVLVSMADAFGNPISGKPVKLSIASGPSGASISGTLKQITSNGVAKFGNIFLTEAGPCTLTATHGMLTGVVSDGFTVNPAAAARLAFVQEPTPVTAGIAIAPAITVDVQDEFGNLVSTDDSNVTLIIKPGSGTPGAVLGGTPTVAAVDGLATFSDISISDPANYKLNAKDRLLTKAHSAKFTITPA